MVVQCVDTSQNRPRQVFQRKLWKRTDRLDQVVKTAIGSKVTHDGDTPLRTVPECVKDAHVRLGSTVSFPVAYPSFENLSYLTITNRDLLDAVNFQAWSVKHLFYRT